MALLSGVLSVGTVATVLPATCVMPFRLEVKNNDNTDAVFIGGPGVTVANGLRLAKEERIELTLAPLDRLYAVSTKSGHSISWLRFTQAC